MDSGGAQFMGSLRHVTCMQILDFEQIQENRLRVHSSQVCNDILLSLLTLDEGSRGYRGLRSESLEVSKAKAFTGSLFLSSKTCISSN